MALLTAIVLALFTVFLVNLSEAGPAADVVAPLLPLIVGGFGIGAARQALRTFRAIGSGPGRVLAVLALLIDIGLIGVALLFVLAMTVGTGIS